VTAPPHPSPSTGRESPPVNGGRKGGIQRALSQYGFALAIDGSVIFQLAVQATLCHITPFLPQTFKIFALCEAFNNFNIGLKGHNIPAQGNALGERRTL